MSLESRAARLVAEYGGTDALSITELYNRVDRALRTSFPGDLWITGEIRSIKVLPRGHCFIDLVDPSSARDSGAPTLNVKCWSTRWRSVRSTLDGLGIALDTGMVVRARGEVQFYKIRGSVDFILTELDTDALLGKVAAERARLVKALVDEGLFDRQRRLPVPAPPLRIGMVASPGTEGYRDFLGRLEASGMAFNVDVVPTQVQGRDAPKSVAAAIRRLGSRRPDVVVLVRGGGSKADLATFDAEPVARAVAGCEMPVWTGIGHTGDQSVADEVANRSFITPTECGQELARMAAEYWRDGLESGRVVARLARERLALSEVDLARQRRSTSSCVRAQLDRHSDRLTHRSLAARAAARGRIDARGRLLSGRVEVLARSSMRAVTAGQAALSVRTGRLAALPARRIEVEHLRVAQWRRLLGAYDYQRQLDRGYSVTRDDTGRVVRSASGINSGARLFTRLSDGELASTVDGPVAAPGRPGTGGDPGSRDATEKGRHDGDSR